MIIRPYQEPDAEAVWNILQETFRAGETYAVNPDITRAQGLAMWIDSPAATFVAEIDGNIVGSYYIKPNQNGGGAHVCNCGYVTARQARGQGLAAAMCAHSQDAARGLGFQAMQFNFVLETNIGAIRLWERAGFDTVGRIPRAFNHPHAGLVDALVMFKWISDKVGS